MPLKICDYNDLAVEQYYDKCQRWYTRVYSDPESLALHYGYWYKNTGSKKEALLNQYKEIAALLKPASDELILDAGCGVGGASIWMAENTGAEFAGITLSSVQLRLALKNAVARGVDKKTKFSIDNYFGTKFSDDTFHKIFGIESFCHSYPEPEYALTEMYRILKPGGAIVISDGFLWSYPESEQEKKLSANFCRGVKMNGWCTKNELIAAFKKAGFINIKFIDRTDEIRNSVRNIFFLGMAAYPFLLLLKSMSLASDIEQENYLFVFAQKKLHSIGLFGYGLFYAEKA